MLELINDVVAKLARENEELHSAERPSGRGLPRSMSSILIGPAANTSVGVHANPAAAKDYQRWTALLNTRGITPVWLVTIETEDTDAIQIRHVQVDETGVSVSGGGLLFDVGELLLEVVAAVPSSHSATPLKANQDDTWPEYVPFGTPDAETGEIVEHPWCPVCQAPRPRIERSTHVVREILAEPEGIIIDAGLLIEIDEELNTQVFTGDAGSDHDLATVLERFVEYGWAKVDRDGDMLRTNVTASEPIDGEVREQMRELNRKAMRRAGAGVNR